ncbi:hypothetical protein ACQQ97_06950 [Anaerovoracaceae bacterium SGI.195]
MVGAVTRGLSLDSFYGMNPGQIIDYCIEYNNTMIADDEEESVRVGTQADFDKF